MSPVNAEPSQGFNLKNILINYRFAIFNALFVLYILFAQKPLLKQIYQASERGKPSVLLAVVMFVALAAEVAGIHLKFSAMLRRAPKEIKEKGRGGCILFVIWVFHMVVNMFLMIFAVSALGFGPDKEPMWLFITLAVVSVLKDLYLIFYAFGIAKAGGSDIGEFVGEGLIFVWGVVAYTSTWVFLSAEMGFFSSAEPALIVMELSGALFIFFMFFLPIQVVYFHEQALQPRGFKSRLGFWLGFSATVISAMLSLVFGAERW